ncbi:MAG: glycosyltransferase, partial [Desulfosalsimonas sp.]
YVGRISKEKNLDVLAAAYRHLCRIRKDTVLLVVGGGPYLQEMKQELAGLRVEFAGPLFNEDLAEAYASSDLFIFPSTTDTFGNVVLEAQASGLPVIVTDQGGPKENLIDGKTGRIVPANDPNSLAQAVYQLLEHPERMLRMKENARSYMEKRTFEQAFIRSWDLYTHSRDKHVFAEAS